MIQLAFTRRSSGRTRPAAVLAIALAAASLVAVTLTGPVTATATTAASNQAGSYQAASLRFTTTKPGRPTGLAFRVDYVNPGDPSAKPPAVREVFEVLAEGARFDTRAPARCTASDAELMLQGAAACPAGSRVGTGYLRLDTGLPAPARYIEADITFLNNIGELIFVNTDRLTGARVVVRAAVTARTALSRAPFLPGTPPDGAAVDVARGFFPTKVTWRGGVRRSYVTTPGTCPRSRVWVNLVRFTYDDGTVQTVRTRNACER
ncbi:hypothetical protein [Nocardioides speluncae]|uniref:hypothetical protein n=1 Tax=Nocardioides speluncae TaxID=2670337 RepID=UPI000D6859D3|nr:hypothetical protein [Nocardioides speluncae]